MVAGAGATKVSDPAVPQRRASWGSKDRPSTARHVNGTASGLGRWMVAMGCPRLGMLQVGDHLPHRRLGTESRQHGRLGWAVPVRQFCLPFRVPQPFRAVAIKRKRRENLGMFHLQLCPY